MVTHSIHSHAGEGRKSEKNNLSKIEGDGREEREGGEEEGRRKGGREEKKGFHRLRGRSERNKRRNGGNGGRDHKSCLRAETTIELAFLLLLLLLLFTFSAPFAISCEGVNCVFFMILKRVSCFCGTSNILNIFFFIFGSFFR